MLARDLGKAVMESYCLIVTVSIWGDGKDLETVVMIAQQCECNATELYT